MKDFVTGIARLRKELQDRGRVEENATDDEVFEAAVAAVDEAGKPKAKKKK